MSTLHSHRSYANIHPCHEATTTIHISTCTRIEVAPIFALNHVKTSFALKPRQHPSLIWSHDNTSYVLKSCQHSWSHEVKSTLHISIEVMPILVFAMKPQQHSTLALALALKLHQYLHWAKSKLHLHWSRANIHLCHEATTTLHISTEVIPILVFAMKPRQYFICTKAVSTSIFATKSWQHSTLAQIFKGNIA